MDILHPQLSAEYQERATSIFARKQQEAADSRHRLVKNLKNIFLVISKQNPKQTGEKITPRRGATNQYKLCFTSPVQ